MIVTSSAQPVERTLSDNLTWQEAVRHAIRSPRQLLAALGLPSRDGDAMAAKDFSVFVPWEFVNRMEPGNSLDPLLLQVLSTSSEMRKTPGFELDPVGDLRAQKQPGLLQKYLGRALLVTTGSCAVHCRYCFRRQYPYALVPKTPQGWVSPLQEIAGDESIEEVILSGGDPLMLADSSLRWLVDRINGLGHIRRLRIHTRMPIVIPQRVNDELLGWLRDARPAVYIVLHANHANEIDASVRRACERLRSTGATLLNQAVLLRGINDTPESQLDLCRRLIDSSVIPYYLHQLDRVHGAAHFEVDVPDGQRIIEFLRAHLPGYGVPQYVCEHAGATSKTPL